ncbi:hypothetical protein [Clostridium intestinale]|uniref:hypothetical protein n=1 Tax=Clostridium intestinale TaxID=36845 RepID=UPI002DD68D8D|nr:hypothetical protein [Clostridium intestinale]WRY53917.1 hypothetical protein P8F83_12055 [Clostridium intestinale]
MFFLVGLAEDNKLQGFYPLDMLDLYKDLPDKSISIDGELHQYLLNGLYKFVGKEVYPPIYTIKDKDLFEEIEAEETETIEIPKSNLEIEVESLRKENESLKLAMVELDTQREKDKLETQLAIAELTSTLLGGE